MRFGLIPDLLIIFVAVYPLALAGRWIAGGLIFRLSDEDNPGDPPAGGWPSVSVLIPAYNEEAVIATSVRAALQVDYPNFEVLVLDDGSTDETVREARAAGGGDPRLEVIDDPTNVGKAARLNVGLEAARFELIVVTDADTHLHPMALRLLVSRISRSPRIAAVAGGPHVTNRGTFLTSLQVLEDASIIGLIRRTHALSGHVGTVAGVVGIFRKKALREIGGYDPDMATEDIDLSWRLLLAGWDTAFEPKALVGMEVPATLRSLWVERSRWARGQGEVLRTHGLTMARWRNRHLWPLIGETAASYFWVLATGFAILTAVLAAIVDSRLTAFEYALAWGIAIAVVAMLQVALAIVLDLRYDRAAARTLLIGPLYPGAYWALNAIAAARAETPALVRGPQDERVTWDTQRESDRQLEPGRGRR